MTWMAWTAPTAAFFIGIGLALSALTLFELRWPSHKRRGFLPLATTRGDRFFIGLLSAAFIHLACLGLAPSAVSWATGLSLLWAMLVLWRG